MKNKKKSFFQKQKLWKSYSQNYRQNNVPIRVENRGFGKMNGDEKENENVAKIAQDMKTFDNVTDKTGGIISCQKERRVLTEISNEPKRKDVMELENDTVGKICPQMEKSFLMDPSDDLKRKNIIVIENDVEIGEAYKIGRTKRIMYDHMKETEGCLFEEDDFTKIDNFKSALRDVNKIGNSSCESTQNNLSMSNNEKEGYIYQFENSISDGSIHNDSLQEFENTIKENKEYKEDNLKKKLLLKKETKKQFDKIQCRQKKIDRESDSTKKRIEFHSLIKTYRKSYIANLETQFKLNPALTAEYRFIVSRQEMPEFVCICCNRLKFERSMCKGQIKRERLHELFSRKNVMSFEEFDNAIFTIYPTTRLCVSCYKSIISGSVPRYAISNGLGFPDVPEEIKILNDTERLLVLPYLPFIQIKPLQKFDLKPQYGVKGGVIHVPVEIAFHKCIPLNTVVHGIIKRCIEHKSVFSEDLVSPERVIRALNKLVNTPLYEGILIDKNLFSRTFSQIMVDAELPDEFLEESLEILINDDSTRDTYSFINGISNENNEFSYQNSALQCLANIYQEKENFSKCNFSENDVSFVEELIDILRKINSTNMKNIVVPSRNFRVTSSTVFSGDQQCPAEYLSSCVCQKYRDFERLFLCKMKDEIGCKNYCHEIYVSCFSTCLIRLPLNYDYAIDLLNNDFQITLDTYLTNFDNYCMKCLKANEYVNEFAKRFIDTSNAMYIMFQLDLFENKKINKNLFNGFINDEILLNDEFWELNSIVVHCGNNLTSNIYICYRRYKHKWYKCMDENVVIVRRPQEDIKDNQTNFYTPY